MKKHLIVIGTVVLLLTIGLSGCSSIMDTVSSKGTCYYDYELEESEYAGYYWLVSEGNKFVIANITVKNEAEQYVSTNPYHWKLKANNVVYPHSTATFDEGVNHKTVEVHKGGIYTTVIIFEIPGTISLSKCQIIPNESSFTRKVDFVIDDSLLT